MKVLFAWKSLETGVVTWTIQTGDNRCDEHVHVCYWCLGHDMKRFLSKPLNGCNWTRTTLSAEPWGRREPGLDQEAAVKQPQVQTEWSAQDEVESLTLQWEAAGPGIIRAWIHIWQNERCQTATLMLYSDQFLIKLCSVAAVCSVSLWEFSQFISGK